MLYKYAHYYIANHKKETLLFDRNSNKCYRMRDESLPQRNAMQFLNDLDMHLTDYVLLVLLALTPVLTALILTNMINYPWNMDMINGEMIIMNIVLFLWNIFIHEMSHCLYLKSKGIEVGFPKVKLMKNGLGITSNTCAASLFKRDMQIITYGAGLITNAMFMLLMITLFPYTKKYLVLSVITFLFNLMPFSGDANDTRNIFNTIQKTKRKNEHG